MKPNTYWVRSKIITVFDVTMCLVFISIACGPEKESPSPRTGAESRYSDKLSQDRSGQDSSARSPRAQKKSEDSKSTEVPEPQASLGWNEPIHLKTFGLAANPNVEGKTLKIIVESLTPGRDDGKLCSECHHSSEASGTYGLRIPQNGTLLIDDPWKNMGTEVFRSWAGPEGWAERFASNSTKPPALRLLMKAWRKSDFSTDGH
jgi:hypothetical protein